MTLTTKTPTVDNTAELKAVLPWAVYDNALVKNHKTGKLGWRKIPKDPRIGENLKTSEPDTWTCSYGEAVAALEEGDHDGIGFLITQDDVFHVTDGDDAWDQEQADRKPEPRKILKEQNTYAEFSPSETGFHAIGRAKKPKHQKKVFSLNGYKVESYDGSWDSRGEGPAPRFITFTGKPLPGYDIPIRDVQGWVDKVPGRVKKDPSFAPEPVDASDEEVIRILKRSKGGERFKELFYEGVASLWEGDGAPYPSQSEADIDLVGMFAWGTGCDGKIMDRLFRSSALMRDKWGEPWGDWTYGEETIDTAIRNCTSTLDLNELKKKEELIERCHHYRMNTFWKKMDLCHLYVAFLSMGYLYGKYVEGEGVYVRAAIRNLNLRSRLVKLDGKDHIKVSRAWKDLQKMGLIVEIEKGGPMGSGGTSLYLVLEPPPLPQNNLHKET